MVVRRAKKKDAATRRTQRTRFDARMEKKPLNSTLFLHSSFIIMHRLRILIDFWARTLVDEFCQIASKDKAISKAKLIPLVYFFRRHVSATSASSASLRPFGVPCITLRVPLVSRASHSRLNVEVLLSNCLRKTQCGKVPKLCLLEHCHQSLA